MTADYGWKLWELAIIVGLIMLVGTKLGVIK